MKKADKKKRMKQFQNEYSLGKALKEGNIVTKISMLIMGFGNIAHKQIGKGLMFFGAECLYIWFMVTSGIYSVSMLPSLGWREQEKYGTRKRVFMNM